MEAEKRIELDGCTYIMRPANAMAAWSALKAAGAVFKGLEVDSGDIGKTKIDIGAILGNLGDPAIAKVEKIVLEHTNVQPEDGKAYRLADQMETHFNDRRGDLIPVLVAGIQYQYADFFTSAMPALGKLLGKAKSLTA
ncbi:MAG: hypothetical protein KA735_04855 [Burkholderiaceae bacterium]|nr:hypothetical protein [Burkholderiaceae bacterium]